jgi:hypothetical protein
MVKKPYCGIGKMGKDRIRGNMKECIDNRQIRMYGLKTVDTKILQANQDKKDKIKSRSGLLRKKARLTGRLKKHVSEIKDERTKDKPDQDKIKKMKQVGRDMLKEIKDIERQIKDIDKLK